MADSNGKWQLAFWIITGLFITVSAFIGQSVIANDLRNNEEHKDIRQCLYDKLNSIDSRLTRIETKLEDK